MRDPEKPQQIIEAAVRVFAREGYYNSRVSDIAREAGIAAGTIYLYFKTKDDILVTLFRDKMAEFVGALRKAIAGESDAASKVRRALCPRPPARRVGDPPPGWAPPPAAAPRRSPRPPPVAGEPPAHGHKQGERSRRTLLAASD